MVGIKDASLGTATFDILVRFSQFPQDAMTLLPRWRGKRETMSPAVILPHEKNQLQSLVIHALLSLLYLSNSFSFIMSSFKQIFFNFVELQLIHNAVLTSV